MTRQLGKFVFGFGAVAIVDATSKDLLSFIDTPGEVTINTKPELISAAGGPGIYPSSARAGRTEGNITLTVNERGNDLYEVLGFATLTDLGAQAAPLIGAPVSVVGTSITDFVTLSVTAGQVPLAGQYSIEVTAADTFVISGATVKGVRASDPLVVAASGSGDTNVGITITRAVGAVVIGDKAVFGLTPAAADGRRFDFIDSPDPVEVALQMFSERASSNTPMQLCTVNRCVLLPSDYMLRSSQYGSEAQELTGRLLVPNTGIPFSVTEYDAAA